MTTNMIDFWNNFIAQQLQKLNSPGYEPCLVTSTGTKAETIQIIEHKYGISLPESYKSFLATTNGLEIYFCNDYPDFKLLPIEHISLYHDSNEEGFDGISELDGLDNEDFNYGKFPFTDDDYNTFYNKTGNKVDITGHQKHDFLESLPIRLEYLKGLITIGLNHYEDILVCLNPNIKTLESELEVWYINLNNEDISPYNARFLSFADMMEYLFSQPNSSQWVIEPPSEALY